MKRFCVNASNICKYFVTCGTRGKTSGIQGSILFVQTKKLRLVSSSLRGHVYNLNGSEYTEKPDPKSHWNVWFSPVKIWQFYSCVYAYKARQFHSRLILHFLSAKQTL